MLCFVLVCPGSPLRFAMRVLRSLHRLGRAPSKSSPLWGAMTVEKKRIETSEDEIRRVC